MGVLLCGASSERDALCGHPAFASRATERDMHGDAKMAASSFFAIHIMTVPPVEGAEPWRPDPDSLTQETTGSPVRGAGRHRAPRHPLLSHLRERVAASWRNRASGTPAPESSEPRQAAPDAAPAPVSAPNLPAAAEILRLLDDIDWISSRMYGSVSVMVDERPLSDRAQLLHALARAGEVTIGLAPDDAGTPDALLKKIIDLDRVVSGKLKAKFWLDVPSDPDDVPSALARNRLTNLWKQSTGLSQSTPPFIDL